ncbi:MAG TPA: hypothetical protein VMH88_04720 [Gemmatimonadales bacterium]|nr:hypothetical protein [Gemmatimonadales bacterium]
MLPSLIVLAVVLGALLWLFGGREDAPEPTAHRRVNESDDIDRTELEQAEREVRDADDEDSVRDWGPGKSPHP